MIILKRKEIICSNDSKLARMLGWLRIPCYAVRIGNDYNYRAYTWR
jgi:hypothetical protein